MDRFKVVLTVNTYVYCVRDYEQRKLLNAFDTLKEAVEWCEEMNYEIISSFDEEEIEEYDNRYTE